PLLWTLFPYTTLFRSSAVEIGGIAFSPAGFCQRTNRIRNAGAREPKIVVYRASPLSGRAIGDGEHGQPLTRSRSGIADAGRDHQDRKSTRLSSSHLGI